MNICLTVAEDMEGLWGEDSGDKDTKSKDSFYSIEEIDGDNPSILYEDIPIADAVPKLKLGLDGEVFPWLFRNKYQNRPCNRISGLRKRNKITILRFVM